MKRVVRLTERDLTMIVRRVIMEQMEEEPIQSGGDLASAGYTDTSEDSLDFYDFMVGEGFQIINESENIDNEIPSTYEFYPRYKKTVGDYTIYVILGLKNPRQTSRISIYDSEGLVAGEDIKNVEEKGVDPKSGNFTLYKIDYNQLKDSLIDIMNKYKTVEENYRRRYKRH